MKIHEKTEGEIIRHHAGRIVDLQSALASEVGEKDWTLDVEKARITFGSDETSASYAVSFIGTYSDVSDTWLWAKANSSLECPPHALSKVAGLITAGRNAGLELFTNDQLELGSGITQLGPWDLAYLAGGLLGLPVYRCPLENGSLFVGVEGIDTSKPITLAVFQDRFRQTVSLLLYDNQDEALKIYAHLHSFAVTPIAGGLRVTAGNEGADFLFKNGFLK